MKKTIILLLFFYFVQQSSFSQSTPYWQQQVNYTIDVSLNDIDNTLDGFVRMDYHNNSSDTLHFIWIHLWQNAYKNDKTAFSDQLLENERTDFYFTDAEKRGYINRLDFKVNGITTRVEDHPEHQDIVKIDLPYPLAPGTACKIETPFHVKLPFNFSRGGYNGKSYQITQWYPKPAVYDRKGWHPIPYLDQGEFYSEFGNYTVQISLPKNYIVAATGELQDKNEINWLKDISGKVINSNQADSNTIKTILYKQDNVHDFAWFADKKFIVKQDTLQLPSGKIIKVFAYYSPLQSKYWDNSIAFIKKSVSTRSEWLGEYPYNTVSAVEAQMGFSGGMEYPTITSISPVSSEAELESTIEHEVGHNWNYGILATNEREHPWMDEGINSYYDNRYSASENITKPEAKKNTFISKRMPDNKDDFLMRTAIASHKDQPIETVSEKFSEFNYNYIAYYKTSLWLKLVEDSLGRGLFDSCMHTFYNRWKFKHPYPEDLKKVFEEVSGRNLDALFSLLNKKGTLTNNQPKRPFKLVSFFSFKQTDKYRYIFVAPAIGNNLYDKLMIGGLIHNYTLPAEKFQFLLAPLYATGSKQLNGLGRLSYHWYPGQSSRKIEISLSGETFSERSFTDSANHTEYFRFSKIVPSVKFFFANKNPRSHVTKFIQWKTFFINQKSLLFTRDTVNDADIITYPITSTYINQFRFVLQNDRALYPYNGELIADQGKEFIRIAFTGNYYFNYAIEGGMNVRFFAGKFFYLGDKTYLKEYNTDAYQLNMTGPKGYEDYTYSNYFYGRNEFEKVSSQQIMQRDGFFKVRTDLLSSKIGRTDDWLMAANFTTDVPKSINPLQMLPIKIPLKAFLDIGTYAGSWKKNPETGKFIYDAGLQLSLFKNTVNIYAPLFYSKVYKDYFKSTIPDKRFWKNISFSIDIQNFSFKKIVKQIPF